MRYKNNSNKIIKNKSDSEYIESKLSKKRNRKKKIKKIKKINKEKISKIPKPLEKCSICLEVVCLKQTNTYFLPCCHCYHTECITPWLEYNVTCPDCRIPVFIQNNDQLDCYNEYANFQRNNYELVRRNISADDNNIGLMFLRNPELFSMDIVEECDVSKIDSLIYREDPTFTEMYEGLFSSDNDNNDDGSDDDGEIQLMYSDSDNNPFARNYVSLHIVYEDSD